MNKVLICVLMILTSEVFAATECRKTTNKIYVGDDAALWLVFSGGGSAYINETDKNFKNIYSLVLAAHMAQKSITVRYSADNVQCSSESRNDIRGVWLEK